MLLFGIKRKAQTLLSVKTLKKKRFCDCFSNAIVVIKDGTYFCYCAYVLRISRYSSFLWVVRTNSGIFLRGLKLYGGSRTQQVLLISKKKIGGNHAFFRDNKASIWGKNAIHCLVF